MYLSVNLTLLVFAPSNWSESQTSISTPFGPEYSIRILSVEERVYGTVSEYVISENEVLRFCACTVWLNVVIIASSVFLRILAVTAPEGVPLFLSLTFKDFIDFPTKSE